MPQDLIVEDRCGLNPTAVIDMPLVTTVADIQALRDQAAAAGQQISLAGMKHSHGGHTTRGNAWMAVTETHNKVGQPFALAAPFQGDPQVAHGITVDAGAVWSQMHHVLNGYGLAPLVHQSSPHFTIGGSISVNCHGRDHRWAAVGNTVISMNVLTGLSPDPLPASRTENPDLFAAVIGGYGACGMIIDATLAVTDNVYLYGSPLKAGSGEIDLATYQTHLRELSANQHPEVMMHIGWLRFTEDKFFEAVAGYDYKLNLLNKPELHYLNDPDKAPYRKVSRALQDEDFGHSEIMRAGWHAAKTDTATRKIIWDMLINQEASGEDGVSFRLNHLRQAISFTAYRGDTDADVLLEYFLPLEQLSNFVAACRQQYLERNHGKEIHISSGSIRLLNQADDTSNLSYTRSRSDAQPMVSLALDLNIKLQPGTRLPTTFVQRWVNDLTDLAISMEGTFYLPYYRFDSDNDRLRRAYNTAPEQRRGYAAQVAAIRKYNPKQVFWNDFLEATFKRSL